MRLRLDRVAGMAGLAAAAVALAGCDAMGGSWDRYQEDFHYSYPLAASGRVEVENFNGSVEISGWDENTVEISGTKFASSPERLKNLRIDVSAAPASVSVRTVRPADGFGNASARYQLRVPRGARLDRIVTSNGPVRLDDIGAGARVRTSNGPVRASHIRGELDIQTSNGGVDVSGLAGPLDVSTSNGPVQLTLDSVANVHAATSNGPITVRVPPEAGADIHARNSNAPISSDFDMLRRSFSSNHDVEGVIGRGGPLLDLSTSNGPIQIVKW